MKKDEELLQRFVDNDLNDEEMKNLFLELSTNEVLRKQFRTLQTLRDELRSFSSVNVPVTIDEKIKQLTSVPKIKMLSNKSALRRVVTKKFTLSMPAFAATILLLLVGSYFAATNIFVSKTETEYVYVVEMQPVIIHSNYSN